MYIHVTRMCSLGLLTLLGFIHKERGFTPLRPCTSMMIHQLEHPRAGTPGPGSTSMMYICPNHQQPSNTPNAATATDLAGKRSSDLCGMASREGAKLRTRRVTVETERERAGWKRRPLKRWVAGWVVRAENWVEHGGTVFGARPDISKEEGTKKP